MKKKAQNLEPLPCSLESGDSWNKTSLESLRRVVCMWQVQRIRELVCPWAKYYFKSQTPVKLSNQPPTTTTARVSSFIFQRPLCITQMQNVLTHSFIYIPPSLDCDLFIFIYLFLVQAHRHILRSRYTGILYSLNFSFTVLTSLLFYYRHPLAHHSSFQCTVLLKPSLN